MQITDLKPGMLVTVVLGTKGPVTFQIDGPVRRYLGLSTGAVACRRIKANGRPALGLSWHHPSAMVRRG